VTLPERALIPSRKLVDPAPREFTHRLVREEPYYFERPVKGAVSAGRLPTGTRVVLLSRQGRTCWVVDRRGLHVAVACGSLEKL
jgi:hypothetical protein